METLCILSLSAITERIILFLLDNKLIMAEEKELYTYGIRQLIFWTINIITIFVLGLCFSVLWQFAIYSVAYFFLRSYSGGYHAQTELKCYLSSIFLFLIIIAAVKLVPSDSLFLLLFTAVAVGIVFALAPIDHENKRLDEIEFKHYRKKAIIILFIEAISIVSTFFIGLTSVSLCLNLAIVTNSVMIILGFIENKKKIKEVSST